MSLGSGFPYQVRDRLCFNEPQSEVFQDGLDDLPVFDGPRPGTEEALRYVMVRGVEKRKTFLPSNHRHGADPAGAGRFDFDRKAN